MQERNRDKVVVVIGASSGIGRATARMLAGDGARLVLASRSLTALEQVRLECEAEGAESLVVATDVGDAAAVDALFEAATSRFGRVDAVVHSAAVLAYGRFEDVPAEVFNRVQTTNIHGTGNVARTALRLFRRQGHGHLVVLGSVVGKIATPLLSSYSTSKWAIHALVRSLQIEVRSTAGVDVSLVSPGAVNTPIYSMAGSYTGWIGRPPPPVDPPEKVARAIVRVLDNPTREESVGLPNHAMVLGFRLLPGVFDAIVLSLMSKAALSRDPVDPNPGNIFEPLPHSEKVHGEWGRHWMRGVGAVSMATAAAGSLVRRGRDRLS